MTPVEIPHRRNDSVTLALGMRKPNRLSQHRIGNVYCRSHDLSAPPVFLRPSPFTLLHDRTLAQRISGDSSIPE